MTSFVELLRPGDFVVAGQGVAEPVGLLTELIARQDELTDCRAFMGISYSGVATAGFARRTRLASYGAMGTLAPLQEAGVLDIWPVNYADVAAQLRHAAGDRLVLLIQVAPADADGMHSLGIGVDFTAELIEEARLVVAEVNDRMPVTDGPRVPAARFAATLAVSRELPQIPGAVPDATSRAIAAHAARLVPDGATLQLGIGSVPAVVAGLLAGRRELRVHSPLAGDWLLDLDAGGALSGSPGSVVVGSAAGSAELYGFLGSSPKVRFRAPSQLSRPDVLAGVPGLVAMNSAVQIDLTGQVNAEVAGDRYLGAVGGQVDLLRGAQLSAGGRSILVLPSTAGGGRRSRIVRRLDDGVVTTPRSGVDLVVTEFGVADLRGLGLADRRQALMAIAHPDHAEHL